MLTLCAWPVSGYQVQLLPTAAYVRLRFKMASLLCSCVATASCPHHQIVTCCQPHCTKLMPAGSLPVSDFSTGSSRKQAASATLQAGLHSIASVAPPIFSIIQLWQPRILAPKAKLAPVTRVCPAVLFDRACILYTYPESTPLKQDLLVLQELGRNTQKANIRQVHDKITNSKSFACFAYSVIKELIDENFHESHVPLA